MSGRRTLRPAWRLCVLAQLALAASCSTLQPVPGVGLAPSTNEWLGHARVSLRDGTELDLQDATISPDSIVGLGGSARTRWAVSRNEVVRVETARKQPVAELLGGVAAGMAGVYLALLLLVAGARL